jgi:CheY-like chemotaxis protein
MVPPVDAILAFRLTTAKRNLCRLCGPGFNEGSWPEFWRLEDRSSSPERSRDTRAWLIAQRAGNQNRVLHHPSCIASNSFAGRFKRVRGCGDALAVILLVDNDPLQAFQRKSILERRFQEVERVGDAADALCLVEQPHFADKLGLVISGLSMPGIGGPEFVAELHTRLPKVPVLVLGSSSEAPGDYAGNFVRFLAKPFALDEMVSAAVRLLSQDNASAA